MTFEWLPQTIIVLLGLGMTVWLIQKNYAEIKSEIQAIKGDMQNVKIEMARFDQHSRVLDKLEIKVDSIQRTGWENTKSLSAAWRMIDGKVSKTGEVYKKDETD